MIHESAGWPSIGGCAIAVMAKASVPGVTKTRLAPPLTFTEAAELNTAFLQDIAEKLRLAGLEERIVRYVAYGPPGSEGFFRSMPLRRHRLMEVWRPNFGECLLARDQGDAGGRA